MRLGHGIFWHLSIERRLRKRAMENIKRITETDGTNFMCTTCFLSLPDKKELLKHVCFDDKAIDSNEDIIYCLNDNDIDSNEETWTFQSSMDISDDINIEREPYSPQLKHTTPPKKPKKDVAMWTDSSTLALLTCYEARKEDLDHPVKRGKIWILIADDLSELGYKVLLKTLFQTSIKIFVNSNPIKYILKTFSLYTVYTSGH
ncbi:uncharacterized protein [Linepithema humile]|uniref:uncharacterized protein isoform X2 n=1 Tax=Linepithema humile TaxID=83485 RepID=UPI00351E49BF